jgi:processive 1,2-diacylglycerol beta-glucosyltransferase
LTDSRPILVLTTSAGGGHVTAGQAVGSALQELAPEARIEVHDVLTWGSRWFRRLYSGGYFRIVQHWPWMMGWLYDTMDDPPGLWDRLRRMFQGVFVGPVVRELLGRQPRLLIHTHFLSAEIAADLRRSGRLDCPQVIVTTDFATHRIWVQEPTERYYTATEEGKVYLTTWGVPPERIAVTGIPVRAAFQKPLSRQVARQQLGLPTEGRMVLLLTGGMGMGPVEAIFRQLLHLTDLAHVVAIAGSNRKLYERLKALAGQGRGSATVVGYTDRMHEYMRAADLAITKPGGLTASEALVCGLPMLIIFPIPGQETRNSDYLLAEGAAAKLQHIRLLRYQVRKLLEDEQALERLRQAARRLARPEAARVIAQDALSMLRAAGSRGSGSS